MILTIPNILTVSRLLLIPVFAYALLSGEPSVAWVAAIAFGVAALTDWFDGFLARRLNQTTDIGKVLDPLVDRILIISTVIILYIKVSEVIPLWAVAIVVGRDAFMVGGWVYLSRRGTKMAVTQSGKVATATLMIALFIVLASMYIDSLAIQAIGVWVFYTGMVLSVASGLNYLKSGITIMQSNQAQTSHK